jgi:hypothetical protein
LRCLTGWGRRQRSRLSPELLSIQKNSRARLHRSRGGINISIRKALTIVSAIGAPDYSIVCIGP